MRMLKSLAELPGERGLEAVERFSGSSLETVRSKTGFMVRVDGDAQMRYQGLICNTYCWWEVLCATMGSMKGLVSSLVSDYPLLYKGTVIATLFN